MTSPVFPRGGPGPVPVRRWATVCLAACIGLLPAAHAASGGGEAVPLYSDLQREAQEGSGVPPPAREDDRRPLLHDDSALRRQAQDILKGPEFAPDEVTRTLKFKKERKPEKVQEKPAWLKALEAFFRSLGDVSRLLIWGGGALLVLVLLFSLHYWWRMSAPGRVRARVALPNQVGGLDIRPESLPEDVAGAALAAWLRGDRESALSLLYRGALSALVMRHGAAIRASSTEQECIRAARKVVTGEAAEFFAGLAQARLQAIYARRWPAEESIRALCAAYSRHMPREPRPGEPVVQAAAA